MTSYIGLIRKDPDSDFSVDFPDFPGCVTAGHDLDEARKMAAEALAFHIAGMREDGEAIPAPSSLETVMQDKNNRDGVAFLVDAQVTPSRSMRLNVMLPEDLVRKIDRTTRNRSRFLAEAAREKLLRTA
jgi:predicted RNase H-like HicB family nuclease